ncbi:nitrate/nitrite transporter NarK [Novosphingobium kunmingense]|uniref:Nitrate/nitrite transporter NarK n=1 Tax=Novosphingobium kunmingense TaxID=1211806 RepID=A0A2N0H6N3_9SPHN|nr:MFS transporter [Novosphingobium kunmingense]PKB14595.1 nitrate/nitrite transporter NarK [Novosphingobium kunmingense]
MAKAQADDSQETILHGNETVTSKPSDSAWSEFRRAWRPLVACAVGLACGLSPIAPYASGFLASAMEQELGVTRAELLLSLVFAPIALVILGRYAGRLIDTHGPRKIAIVSTLGLGLAELLVAAIGSRPPGYYAAWAVLAVLSLGTLPMTYAKLLNSWFERGRGMALGLALAATGLAGVVLPLVVPAAIEAVGWRGGYLALAAMPLLIGLPVLLAWLHEAPTIAIDGAGPLTHTGVSVAQALRSYRFWALAAAALVLAFGVSGLVPNLYSLLLERGLDPAEAKAALAGLALSVTVGRILSGFLLDRLWAPTVCALLVLPAAGALWLLLSAETADAIVPVAVVALGLIAGAEFDLVAYMTVRYFGQLHFSELYGMQYAAFGIGAGAAPAAYGALRALSQSYAPAVMLSIALLLLAVCLIFTLGRYPDRFPGSASNSPNA